MGERGWELGGIRRRIWKLCGVGVDKCDELVHEGGFFFALEWEKAVRGTDI
jgi:hypothetical protein